MVSSQLNRVASWLLLGWGLPVCVPAIASAEPAPAALERPLARAVEQRLSRTTASTTTRFAQASGADPAPTPGQPFFKTRRGVVTGVLMAAGLGWVLYSKSHDRVRSPANQ